MPAWIDTHAHLDDDRFTADLPAVLARAAEAGVGRVITIGVDVATSQAACRLAQSHDTLSAVVGIQPNHAADAESDDWDVIVRLAEAGRPVVALGETGLDRHWDYCPFPVQQEYFVRHLDLARAGIATGGGQRNLDHYGDFVEYKRSMEMWELSALFDPQTSGPLLAAVDPREAPKIADRLRSRGEPAWIVGEAVAGAAGAIIVA